METLAQTKKERNDAPSQKRVDQHKDKRMSKGLREELEALLGAGHWDQVRKNPKQAVTEDHLQLHRQPHRNVQEPAPPGKIW